MGFIAGSGAGLGLHKEHGCYTRRKEWVFERKAQNSQKEHSRKEPVKQKSGERDGRRAVGSISDQSGRVLKREK